jgi:hypothetical protein
VVSGARASVFPGTDKKSKSDRRFIRERLSNHMTFRDRVLALAAVGEAVTGPACGRVTDPRGGCGVARPGCGPRPRSGSGWQDESDRRGAAVESAYGTNIFLAVSEALARQSKSARAGSAVTCGLTCLTDAVFLCA